MQASTKMARNGTKSERLRDKMPKKSQDFEKGTIKGVPFKSALFAKHVCTVLTFNSCTKCVGSLGIIYTTA